MHRRSAVCECIVDRCHIVVLQEALAALQRLLGCLAADRVEDLKLKSISQSFFVKLLLETLRVPEGSMVPLLQIAGDLVRTQTC